MKLPSEVDEATTSDDRRSTSSTPADREADRQLIVRLLAGDETAFAALVSSYHTTLVRLAKPFVADHATAEEVAQDAWLGVLKGLERFEGRSSLKTWIFRILVNRAKTRGTRDKRMVPVAFDGSDGAAEPVVDPERFDRRGSWTTPPHGWLESDPEKLLLDGETGACIERAIDRLPPNQRTVISLRDVQGLDSEEVCNVLEISQTNQRVLLHRARSKVRRALEEHFAGRG